MLSTSLGGGLGGMLFTTPSSAAQMASPFTSLCLLAMAFTRGTAAQSVLDDEDDLDDEEVAQEFERPLWIVPRDWRTARSDPDAFEEYPMSDVDMSKNMVWKIEEIIQLSWEAPAAEEYFFQLFPVDARVGDMEEIMSVTDDSPNGTYRRATWEVTTDLIDNSKPGDTQAFYLLMRNAALGGGKPFMIYTEPFNISSDPQADQPDVTRIETTFLGGAKTTDTTSTSTATDLNGFATRTDESGTTVTGMGDDTLGRNSDFPNQTETQTEETNFLEENPWLLAIIVCLILSVVGSIIFCAVTCVMWRKRKAKLAALTDAAFLQQQQTRAQQPKNPFTTQETYVGTTGSAGPVAELPPLHGAAEMASEEQGHKVSELQGHSAGTHR